MQAASLNAPAAVCDAIAEPESPVPPRFRWLKRGVLGAILLAVVLIAVRFVWGEYADRKLAYELAKLESAGFPTGVAGLQTRHVTDEENAVLLLLQAMQFQQKAGVEPPSQSNLDFEDSPPYPYGWHQAAKAAIAANQQTLGAVRQARELNAFDWNIAIGSPLMAITLPHLSPARQLTFLLVDAAAYSHVNDNDGQAIEYLRDAMQVGRSIDSQPFLISHIVSNGIRSTIASKTLAIAPTLRVRATNVQDATAASPEQVRALMADLLRHADSNEHVTRAISHERIAVLDTVDVITRGATMLKPAYQLDKLRFSEYFSELASVSGTADYSKVEDFVAAHAPTDQENPARTFDMLNRTITYWPRSIFRSELQCRLDERFAATALAIALRRAVEPTPIQSLTELVPAYLQTVPLDPYSSQSAPIRLVGFPNALPDGGERLMLASVGSDGVDDSMSSQFTFEPRYQRFQLSAKKMAEYRDLLQWVNPNRRSNSSNAVDQDGDQPDDPR